MKHPGNFSALIDARIITSAVMFNACSKQEKESPSQVENPQKDYTIYKKLSSFRTQMEFYKNNPTLKSNESVEVDSAIWLLEGAMNLTYGFPYKEYTDFEKGTAIINLEKDNDGKINYNELALKYQQVIDEAREDYYGSAFEEKGLYVVDLEVTEETATEVTFTVETITGCLGEDNPASPVFEDWLYGDDLGGCNLNQQGSSDAAQELDGAYPQQLSEEYSLVDPIQETIEGGMEWLRRPNDELDNDFDYYIYFVSEDIEDFEYDTDCCLDANEMNQYYQYLEDVLLEIVFDKSIIPTTHEFIRFTSAKGLHPWQSVFYFHRFECTFALKYDRPNNDPAIPL